MVPSDRVQLLYARHDQLTPEALTLKYATTRGIAAVHGYDHSHATMLLAGDIRRDYREFLSKMTLQETGTNLSPRSTSSF